MTARLPSVKILAQITSYPKELRKVLAITSMYDLLALLRSDKPFKRSEFTRFNRANFNGCPCGAHLYNSAEFFHLKMSMADELCETCGLEYIPKGHNRKSPAISYLNSGDPYTATLLYVNDRYRVGCWGDIVERGHYD